MKKTSQKSKSEIILYQSQDGSTKIDVVLENETAWLSQAQLVDLYQSSKANVSEHIKNIFSDRELDESVVVRKIRTTTKHGAIGIQLNLLESGSNYIIPISKVSNSRPLKNRLG